MLTRLLRAIGLSPVLRSSKIDERARIADGLVERADAERDGLNFSTAAKFYEQALKVDPDRAAIHIQCGHMFKEAGDLPMAERHYLEAGRLWPDDADLALQLGHFYKVAGRADERDAAYRRAADLRPGWAAPLEELANIQRADAPPPQDPAWAVATTLDLDRLAPELAPTPPSDRADAPAEGVYINRLGARRERSRWGPINTLRGVEAVRGYCISASPMTTLQILVDGVAIHEEPLTESAGRGGEQRARKSVFNAWVDFSAVEPGLRRIALRFLTDGREARRHVQHVVVAPPRTEADFPASDSVVELSRDDPRPAEAQIRSRASMVRAAARAVAPTPRNVLVMRTDQLGDLVTSIPAVRRLRELFPGARLVGLLTASNAELAETLHLFDQIVVIDFPDDDAERRRIMTLDAQEALRVRLQTFGFDVAIDLAESGVSRPLLLLSGARFLYGFRDREWPWLTSGFDGATRDPANGQEAAAQSTRVMALVERLGATFTGRAEIIRRADLSPDSLRALGLDPDRRYAVLHTGARIAFSRWPYYDELAAIILDRTDLDVVLVSDNAEARSKTPPALVSSPRVRLIDTRLPFDAFDALLSFCAVFVGNDSGPKHLAALRGAPVVSLHSARINWNEWGQEVTGSIISRRVPCAGCVIHHESDECGKDFACVVDIKVDEVFAEMMRLLAEPPSD